LCNKKLWPNPRYWFGGPCKRGTLEFLGRRQRPRWRK
jgi:hypothetical protein